MAGLENTHVQHVFSQLSLFTRVAFTLPTLKVILNKTPFAPGKTQIQKLHAVIFHTSCGDLLQSIRLGNQSRSPNPRQAVNQDKVMVTIPPMSY